MTRDAKQAEDLARLTGAAWRAAETRMAGLRREIAAVEARLAELGTPRPGGTSPDDPALRAGAALRWQRWIERRRAALTAELARLRAREADLREDLRLSFGRHEAARALAERIRAQETQVRARRAERRG